MKVRVLPPVLQEGRHMDDRWVEVRCNLCGEVMLRGLSTLNDVRDAILMEHGCVEYGDGYHI